MTDHVALREKIAALLRAQYCDRHAMDLDRYGFASLDVHDQGCYLREAEAILALIEPLGLEALAREVWESVPASFEPTDPMVTRHAVALNALGAAIKERERGSTPTSVYRPPVGPIVFSLRGAIRE